MPLAVIQHKAGGELRELAGQLAKKLPHIIAPALSVETHERHDGKLTSEDIEVWCFEGTSDDVNTKDLEIIIWAHEYPERLKNFEERKDMIVSNVRRILNEYGYQDVKGFVWILLQPSAFGRF